MAGPKLSGRGFDSAAASSIDFFLSRSLFWDSSMNEACLVYVSIACADSYAGHCTHLMGTMPDLGICMLSPFQQLCVCVDIVQADDVCVDIVQAEGSNRSGPLGGKCLPWRQVHLHAFPPTCLPACSFCPMAWHCPAWPEDGIWPAAV